MTGKFRFAGQKGFTLMELIVVIVIIGILAAVAFPLIAATLPKYRLRAAARELTIDFKKAKMEAVKRNRTMLLVFTPVAAPPGGSYRMCVDDNNSGDCDAGDTVLKNVTMPNRVGLVASTFAGNQAGYTNRGLPWNNQTGAVQLRSDIAGSRNYTINLTVSGQVVMQ